MPLEVLHGQTMIFSTVGSGFFSISLSVLHTRITVSKEICFV